MELRAAPAPVAAACRSGVRLDQTPVMGIVALRDLAPTRGLPSRPQCCLGASILAAPGARAMRYSHVTAPTLYPAHPPPLLPELSSRSKHGKMLRLSLAKTKTEIGGKLFGAD